MTVFHFYFFSFVPFHECQWFQGHQPNKNIYWHYVRSISSWTQGFEFSELWSFHFGFTYLWIYFIVSFTCLVISQFTFSSLCLLCLELLPLFLHVRFSSLVMFCVCSSYSSLLCTLVISTLCTCLLPGFYLMSLVNHI